MIGKAHLQMLKSCLSARSRRDEKRLDHPMSAQRLAVIQDCEKILSGFGVRLEIDAIEVALILGWQPEAVVTGSLRLSAQEWLDSLHPEWVRRPTVQALDRQVEDFGR